MRMDFSGASEITAPIAKVWERLTNPDFVAGSAPGVETVRTVDPSHFEVISGLGLGAIRVKFQLDVELSDVVPPERLRMTARGHAPGSTVDVVSQVRLQAVGDDRTRLSWAATSTIGGTLASLGGRLLEGTARRLTEQFWTDFARRAGAG